MLSTLSGESVPLFTVSSGPSSTWVPMWNSLPPALAQRIVDTKLIQSAGHDEVDEVVHGLGAVVEAGREKQDRRARTPRRQHRLEVDRGERRLARHQDELPLLLERDRG